MNMVSIQFKGGKVTVADESGTEVAAERAVIYLVTGNERPVAGVTLVDGTHLELPVSELSFSPDTPPAKAAKKR